VTSPPYFGLRDYGTATWEGGDTSCDHVHSYNKQTGVLSNDDQDGWKKLYQDICGKCGASRIDQQIGQEQSPEEYVERLVDVFREVKRILRDDGTLWLNLGDSYAGNNSQASNNGRAGYGTPRERIVNRTGQGLKPKDLIGIPWRVAFALQSDGWYLRQDIIWHKPNPMPESVTDRCTKAHEYIFLMSKSEHYYYDSEAIKEKAIQPPHAPGNKKLDVSRNDRGFMGSIWGADGMRNKRSVWTVNTKPYTEAHFAVYPTKLIEPCILAGCPVGGTVFDPFTGSGTTGFVSLSHNGNFIGTELNPEYIKIAEHRLSAIQHRMELI
jgi:DNA modification methylase